jgi:hypothetical protein
VITIEFVNRLDDSDSTDVVTFSTISNVTNFHLVNSINLSSFKVEFNSVLDWNFLSKEFKGSTIMSSEITDFVWSNEFLLYSAKFEVFFLSFKLDKFESSLNIIKNSIWFIKFWNVDNIHKTTWVLWISSNLLINNK